MHRTDIIDSLRNLRPKLAGEGVAHLAMFGSRARGDANVSSDLDLLLEVDPEVRFSLLNLIGVEHIISQETGLAANAFMRRSLDETFRRSIEDDIVDVF